MRRGAGSGSRIAARLAGALVVCGGGGGVPVIRAGAGELAGVEAVVDKDLTAAELAIALKADRLLVLTDGPAIIRGYGTANGPALAPSCRLVISG
jgi:carbamate kinase